MALALRFFLEKDKNSLRPKRAPEGGGGIFGSVQLYILDKKKYN